MLEKYQSYILPLAFLVAFGSTIVSIILSSVYNLPPCQLCWYQRVLMFPLPIILGVAILLRDRLVYWYVLPFSIGGMIISFYQSLLQWGVISESSLTCNGLISCGEAQVDIFGFLTIPFGAFLTFSALTLLMWAQKKYGKKIDKDFKQQLDLLIKLIAVTLIAALVFLAVRQVVS